MPQFNPKKKNNLFECLTGSKTDQKKCLETQKVQMSISGTKCRMALYHANELRLWWVDSLSFFNTCFAFSSLLKDFFFVCDHETLSYSTTNSSKLI